MDDKIAYEARALNRDPRISALINTAYTSEIYLGWYCAYNVLQERLFTIYSMEGMTRDMYNVLDRALRACYNK